MAGTRAQQRDMLTSELRAALQEARQIAEVLNGAAISDELQREPFDRLLARRTLLRLACDGYYSRVFEFDEAIVLEFGRFLVTPQAHRASPKRWFLKHTGHALPPSTLHRFVQRFRMTADTLLDVAPISLSQGDGVSGIAST